MTEVTHAATSAQVKLFSNRAEALLKREEFQHAEHACTAALELDPKHAKSLHRRARARMELGPWIGGEAALGGAADDLRALIRLGGSSIREASELLQAVEARQALHTAATNRTTPPGHANAVPLNNQTSTSSIRFSYDDRLGVAGGLYACGYMDEAGVPLFDNSIQGIASALRTYMAPRSVESASHWCEAWLKSWAELSGERVVPDVIREAQRQGDIDTIESWMLQAAQQLDAAASPWMQKPKATSKAASPKTGKKTGASLLLEKIGWEE